MAVCFIVMVKDNTNDAMRIRIRVRMPYIEAMTKPMDKIRKKLKPRDLVEAKKNLKMPITARVHPKVLERLQKEAEALKVTPSLLLETILKDYFKI